METSEKFRKFGMFGAWYMVSGMLAMMLTSTLLYRLYEQGLTKEDGGKFLAIVGLPWVLKPLWGPLVDKYGSKFWWAVMSSLVMAALVLVLPFVEGATYAVIVLAVLLPNLVRSLQDVAVDGLAIQVFDEKTRGACQTVMKVCAYAGTLFGGAGAMFLLSRTSWQAVCVLAAILTIVAGAIVPFVFQKKSVQRDVVVGRAREGPAWKDLLFMFKSPIMLWALFLGVLAYPAQGLTTPNFYPWWQEMGLQKDAVAFLFAGAPWFQIGGTLIGGLLAAKLPRRKAFLAAVGCVVMAYAAVDMLRGYWDESAVVIGLSWGTGLADGLYEVVLFTTFMDLANKKFTATSFAVFMAATNLSASWLNWAGGMLGEHVSVGTVFWVGASCQLIVLIPMRFIVKPRNQQ